MIGWTILGIGGVVVIGVIWQASFGSLYGGIQAPAVILWYALGFFCAVHYAYVRRTSNKKIDPIMRVAGQ